MMLLLALAFAGTLAAQEKPAPTLTGTWLFEVHHCRRA